MSEAFPKQWRKEPKFCQERGVNERNLRKEPKLGIAECERRKTFGKCQRPGRLGLPEVADCSDRDGEERGAPAEAAKDWDGLNCRKKPKLWRARGWLGAEEDENLRKHPNLEELIYGKLRQSGNPAKPLLRLLPETGEASALNPLLYNSGNNRGTSAISSGRGAPRGRAGRERGGAGAGGPWLIS